MPYQLVTYTFYPSESGGYSYFGDYFSQANADVTGGGTSEDQFVAFNALQIEDAIASFSDGVDSVELSYKLSNNDIFQTQNITATDEYYASIGHQSLVEADTTNTSGESANSAADVFRDIDDSSGAYVGATQTEGVKDTSVTESYDVTSDVANAAAASRDLIVGFTIPQSEIGLTHVSNASITVTGFVPYDLPTVSDTDANQPITDDHSTRPFANVIIADPGNTSGNGDDVFITLLQNGNATSQLGALSLSPADTTAGQGLTDFGGGNYELGAVTSLATLQRELSDLVFTPAKLQDGEAPQTLVFELDLQSGASGTVDNQQTSVVITQDTACYCRGTLILTDRGEVAVEDLRNGDRVVTLSGRVQPIVWIGRRAYTGRFLGNSPKMLPVVFRAGCLGEGLPRRDLYVSPAHAMFLDGVLIPAGALVNGSTIVQTKAAERVEYFHIELAEHDVILAEGAASETFMDDDSRGMFHNAAAFARLYPDAPRPAGYCARRVEGGFEVEAIRRQLTPLARAA